MFCLGIKCIFDPETCKVSLFSWMVDANQRVVCENVFMTCRFSLVFCVQESQPTWRLTVAQSLIYCLLMCVKVCWKRWRNSHPTVVMLTFSSGNSPAGFPFLFTSLSLDSMQPELIAPAEPCIYLCILWYHTRARKFDNVKTKKAMPFTLSRVSVPSKWLWSQIWNRYILFLWNSH